ncbi:MAG: rhomboid family intramembrane serine protease [Candidatus Marisimplicoccus sp.]
MELGYRYFTNQPIFKKIIIINVIVFLLPLVSNTFLFLFNIPQINIIKFFDLHPNFEQIIMSPWSIITYSFFHIDFFHIFWNMFILYIVSDYFLSFLDNKKFLEIYFYGAILGGLLFIVSYNIFPAFENSFSPLIGSSAAVYSLLIFVCAYFPDTSINLIFFNVKLKNLGLFYVLLSLIQIPFSNAGGNIAHLGGALYGFYYAKNFNLSNSPFDFIINFVNNVKTKPKENRDNQKDIDIILDKISKSGYESLTKREKEFLFKNSKKD